MIIAKNNKFELINNSGKYEIYKDGKLIFFALDDIGACDKFVEYLRKDGNMKAEVNFELWAV